jgi:bla regulator protein blaR1
MTNLFIIILNMSITASYVALVVIVARYFLRRAPKIFSYILWSAVMIRLVIPISFSSSFSILRLVQPQANAPTGKVFMEFVPHALGMLEHPVVDVGVQPISNLIHSSLPGATLLASVNPMQIILWIGSMIWITVGGLLLLYSISSYLRLQASIRTATRVRDNIYETDRITTPFVWGFLKPRILIPTGMSEHELPYILLHEHTHILRRDYLIKPFAFLLLIVHWFNPLLWMSYALMCKDMEMSCDERVIHKMGERMKGSYSNTLLSLSVNRSGLRPASPLAFGENHVKARIKNIVSYRPPSSWRVACSALVVAVLIVGCTANPLVVPSQPAPQQVYNGYDLDILLKNKTLYVGNAGKVGGLIGGLPKPEGLQGKGIELQTKAQPYGLTINYVVQDSMDLIKSGTMYNGMFYRNSVLLLSLIDNVDSVTYAIDDSTGPQERFTLTREQADRLLGGDVRKYGADEISLRQLIDRLDGENPNELSGR